MNLAKKRIVVTGGAGFLGSHVVNQLRKLDCTDIFIPRSHEYDLRKEHDVNKMLQDFRPDLIVESAPIKKIPESTFTII
ncbi:NAD-dependent epimerase/dehydratase family protein [Brevibacillus sp. 179-C9.3 HS]|uniref:NAD-dependent epimerase/dehydratase family protein n=1 Tax=unclassified Brevibacillus TaxID=2684853 RepID=UPI0039A367F7